MKRGLRVAVVHDWLTGMRGGEVVLEAILRLYPSADLYTLLHIPQSVTPFIEKRKIYTSFINSLPFSKKIYRHYLPLFPTAIELFDFHGYDLVISSSHCVARGVIVPPGIPHICYMHTPMRYVWDMYHHYFKKNSFIGGKIVPFFANYLRMWDMSVTPRVDRYVCNSTFVAERMKRYYGVDAVVVHPPCVKSNQVSSSTNRENFYLVFGAFVPYKRVDLAISAFKINKRKLVIAGFGPEDKNYKIKDNPNITILRSPTDDEVKRLYRRAKALIFPGMEDFGIIPVEAQAAALPVIAYKRGGALESVADGRTGLFFNEQTPESLNEAIEKFEKMSFPVENFKKQLESFTDDKFKQSMQFHINALFKKNKK